MSVPAPHPAAAEVPGYLALNSVVPGTAHRRSAGHVDPSRSIVLAAGGAAGEGGAACATPAPGPETVKARAAVAITRTVPTRERPLTAAGFRPAAPPLRGR